MTSLSAHSTAWLRVAARGGVSVLAAMSLLFGPARTGDATPRQPSPQPLSSQQPPAQPASSQQPASQQPASQQPASQQPSDARLPTLFIVGDSTVKNRTAGLLGWGDPIANFFDKTKIKVDNRALGGRSSRTYQTEGLWDKVLTAMKPGDFVLIQFGHNDGGSLTQGRARASLKGTGKETEEVTDDKTGKKETVHTFGWYMRKYAADAKAKGATPIVLSLVPRNIWKDDHTVARASNDYGKWAAEAAKAEGAFFVDLNEIIAKQYEQMGPEKVKTSYFVSDHTHTNPAGAQLNAASVVEGLRGLKDCPLCRTLLPAAEAGGTSPARPGK